MAFLLPTLLALTATHADLDHFIEMQRRIADVPGVSVAVVKFGKVVYMGGSGEADLENGLLAKADTVYRLGSITKQFTATMIMQLIREGKLSLAASLGSILPDAPEKWKSATIRQLLSHTAGVPNYTDVPGFLELIRKPVTPEHINDNVMQKPLDFQPGTNWNYSNSGYVELGLILQKLDGRTYDKSLHARILDPLGMKQTYFAAQDSIVPHRARGYSEDSGKTVNSPYIDMVWPFSAGAMESTVVDLSKWDAALYGDKILDRASLDLMWTPVKVASGASRPYGFGWQVYDMNRVPVVAHGGGIPGFSSFIERAPSLGLTVIVLTNSDNGNGQMIADHVAEEVEPKLRTADVPIEDTNPAATATIRRVVLSLSAGKVESQLLSKEMAALFTPEVLAQTKRASDNYGPLSSLTLIKSDSANGKLTRSYRVHYRNTTLTGDFVIDASGKIESGRMHP